MQLRQNTTVTELVRGSQTFGELYYRCGCGPDPYERNEAWLPFYARIIEHIIRSLAPKTVLDAGCALGMMVEAFWDRGVEAKGVDISEYAIANVRPDMREHCRVASLTDPLPGRYDLVTCIEVLEHMPAEAAEQAIRNLTEATDAILFSSSPYDFEEITHINVRPPLSWIRLFGQHGFWPDLVYDASYVLPHTMLLRRGEAPSEDALTAYIEKLRLQHELNEVNKRIRSITESLAVANVQTAEARAETEAVRSELRVLENAQAAVQNDLARLRTELAAAQAAVSASHKEAEVLRADVAKAQREVEETRADVRLAQAETQSARAETNAVRQRLAAIETSTSWRATRYLRGAFNIVPLSVRRGVRRGVNCAWSIAVPHRIRAKLHRTAMRNRVAASPLFDAAWYLRQYSDVATAKSDPAMHYVLFGAAEGRDPGPHFSTRGYLSNYPDVARAGLNPLVHYEEHGRTAGLLTGGTQGGPAPAPSTPLYTVAAQDDRISTVDVVDQALGHLRPLPVFSIARGLKPRITMVTDSLAASHFYGGVGTATILAALWAKRRGAVLRITTLRTEPVRDNVSNLLRILGITPPDDIEFCHTGLHASNRPLDVGSEDLFLTTSWWSTANMLGSIPVERLLYILQEDERMFYPGGDAQLRAEETMGTPSLRRIINTKLLYDFLSGNGIRGLDTHGTWFEPAFPESVYHPEQKPGDRMNFFFYARPNNDRNLYLRGLEALNTAVTRGVLKPDDWKIHFVGKDLQPMALPGGFGVTLVENLSWDRYAAMMRSMDLGLSLMLTPHPSYPPLDLAACGAVAVTNRCGPKQSLAQYSENLICAEPTVDALVEAIAEGVTLARNGERRQANYARQGLARSWQESFSPVLDWIEGN